jgi:nitroimidazol reductase NimA-like FMN-containing flavoprotein (pyridoxamine 5'-phosphate oxidase superfamily)
MRKHKRQLSLEETKDILVRGKEGVLGTLSKHGYPYTVPVNYVYFNDAIYFHSALEGEKIDNIKEYNKVSFTVITKDTILAEKFSTDFESAIVFGRAELISPSKEILMELIKKYSSDFLESGHKYVEKSFQSTQLVKITIDHMTGKKRM